MILLDLAIADVNGYELVERLSSDPATNSCPILVFSTSADLDAVTRAHTAGAADYLVTPYDPATLEHKLESLLECAMSRV